MVEWLQQNGRRFLVVATKADRLSGNQLPGALRRLREEFQIEPPLPFSARTGAGREELWRRIRQACGREDPDATLAS